MWGGGGGQLVFYAINHYGHRETDRDRAGDRQADRRDRAGDRQTDRD